MRKNMRFMGIICILIALVAIFCTAAFDSTKHWNVERGNALFLNDVYVIGTLDSDGAQAIGGDMTLENGEIITNGTDGVVGVTFNDDASELGDWRVVSTNTGTTDTDTFRHSWWFEDSASESTEGAYVDVVIDDQTTATEDLTFLFGVRTAGTLASELGLNGAALYPHTNEGLDLGTSSKKFKDLYIDGTAYLDAGDIGAATITTLNGHDEARVAAFSFYDVDVAASQSAGAWGVDASAGAGGANFVGIPMPIAGSVIGISVYVNDARTSGTLTADATINTIATGLQAVIDDDPTTTATTMQANDADTFTVGQLLGVKVTTSAPWTPTTADAIVVVWVEY